MPPAIKIEDLSKRYRLGVINRDMLYKDLQSRWAKIRGKPDPNAPITHIHQNRIEKGDEFWALRNISMEVPEGSIFGIIGRNGAGKSTLLKILSQITAPTEGQIKVRGRISSLLEVGTGFHPELTGRENVYLNGAILGMNKKEVAGKFDEIVEFSEIENFIDTPVKRYSSGMYVRLAFGVAAHLDPDILIVDEVLAVGDAAFQKKCILKMGGVAKEGRTVILVTHSMALAESLADTCAWIHEGNTKMIGPAREVVRQYLDYADESAVDIGKGLGNHRLRRGPGHVRVSNFRLKNGQDTAKNKFNRGEKIYAKVELRSFKQCADVGIVVALKIGISGALLQTRKICVSSNGMEAGTSLEFEIEIDTASIPAAVYDLYVWVGPYSSEVEDEYYDILDGLLPPLEIRENSHRINARTIIEACLVS